MTMNRHTGSQHSRREFLWQLGGGLGGIALSTLLAEEGLLAASSSAAAEQGALGGKLHHKPRAKRVVQLFMAGGASHLDLWDYKPELVRRHGQEANFGEPVEAFQNGLGPWLRPIWDFRPYGQSGRQLSDVVAPLGACVDDMAFIHNMVGKTGIHSQATLLQATGFQMPGFPGMGCWISYGLGSMNDNLPAFVVLPDHRGFASNGTKNWDAAFLPSQHSGTVIAPSHNPPIFDLQPDARAKYLSARSEADTHALLARLNGEHASQRPGDQRLEARIRSYELAARMQLAAPDALDVTDEPRSILKLYGLDAGRTSYPQEINAPEETDYFAASAWWPGGCWSGACGSCRFGRAMTTASRAAIGIRTKMCAAITARWPKAWPAARRP